MCHFQPVHTWYRQNYIPLFLSYTSSLLSFSFFFDLLLNRFCFNSLFLFLCNAFTKFTTLKTQEVNVWHRDFVICSSSWVFRLPNGTWCLTTCLENKLGSSLIANKKDQYQDKNWFKDLQFAAKEGVKWCPHEESENQGFVAGDILCPIKIVANVYRENFPLLPLWQHY